MSDEKTDLENPLVKNPKEVNSIREMNVCPCRQKKGETEGWCGVTGPGVPACDH